MASRDHQRVSIASGLNSSIAGAHGKAAGVNGPSAAQLVLQVRWSGKRRNVCSPRAFGIMAKPIGRTEHPMEDRGARISGMDALAPIPHSGSRDADGLRAADIVIEEDR